jgi:ELWxxDGT repeat protein
MSHPSPAVRVTRRFDHTVTLGVVAALTLALCGVLLAPAAAASARVSTACATAAPDVRTTTAADSSGAPGSVVRVPADAPDPGAVLVKEPYPGEYGEVSQLVAVGSRLFFRATDGVHGIELWVSDGTEGGTHMVRDIRAGSRGSKPNGLHAVGGKLFFSAIDATHGRELWVSDGTKAGTALVRDIRAGSRGSSPGPITVMGGIAYFAANDQIHGVEVWRSNGTRAGTRLIRDNGSGKPGYIGGLTVMGHRLYYGNDRNLWVTDGTRSGTHWLMPRRASNEYIGITGTAVVGSRLYLGVGVQPESSGCAGMDGWSELWRTDGTRAGTRMLDVAGLHDGAVTDLVAYHDRLYFIAPYDHGHRRLWRSNGTTAGTDPVRPKGFAGDIDGLFAAADRLYFTTYDVRQLWSTDGTSGGEHRLDDGSGWAVDMYWPDERSGDRAVPFVTYQGRAWFAAFVLFDVDDEGHANGDVWSTDGTAVGTRQETYLGPLTSTFAEDLAVMGQDLYFAGRDANHSGLWRLAH